MAHYTVQRDEDLHHILHRMGKSHVLDAVMCHPENKRAFATGAAAMLRAGDVVEIPDEPPPTVLCHTGTRRRFCVRPPQRHVSLRLADRHGVPLRGQYNLSWSGGSAAGELSDGHLDAELPVSVTEARLTVGELRLTLHLGRLDPIDSTAGLQARLANLGLLGGGERSGHDADTSAAVGAFQRRHGLPVTGHADPATRRKLVEVYGC
jgi:hypothetical protein